MHTWSLGVEEQFYIFFPVLLVLIAGWFPAWRKQIITACALVSLILCIAITPGHADAAFYMIPARAWELLAGSMLALGIFPEIRNMAVREILAIAGVAMTMFAVLAFSSATPFPGYAALLPVAGSALIIHAGQGTKTGRVLSFGPLVFIGLISYSLYLWHWPVIVFTGAAGLNLHPAFVIAASIALAYLTWRFVEAPFRSRSAISRPRIFALYGLSSAAALGLTAFMLSQNGYPSRFTPQVVALDDAIRDISPKRASCHSMNAIVPLHCTLGSDTPATVAIWADSHGAELAYALGEAGGGGAKGGASHSLPAAPVPRRLIFPPHTARYVHDITQWYWPALPATRQSIPSF